jgi:hypothetical protein
MSAGARAVCNAGPLMALVKLNLLHLPKRLYGRIYYARSAYEQTVLEACGGVTRTQDAGFAEATVALRTGE